MIRIGPRVPTNDGAETVGFIFTEHKDTDCLLLACLLACAKRQAPSIVQAFCGVSRTVSLQVTISMHTTTFCEADLGTVCVLCIRRTTLCESVYLWEGARFRAKPFFWLAPINYEPKILFNSIFFCIFHASFSSCPSSPHSSSLGWVCPVNR